MTNTLFLFRHGLATKSTNGYGAHIFSAQLLPEGIAQTEKIGGYLKNIQPSAFYSSAYPRCIQTSEIIADILRFPYQINEHLNEYNEITFKGFQDRIKSFLKNISSNKGNIFICTHVAVIVCIKKILLGEKLEEHDVFTNTPLPGTLEKIQERKIEIIHL